VKQIGPQTIISISSLIAVVVMVVTVVSAFDGTKSEIGKLQVQQQADEKNIDDIYGRQDKADERWVQVLNDLSQIKERLGIVEGVTHSNHQN
jgi:hypothetical protein